MRECRREMGIEVAAGDLAGVFEDSFLGIPVVALFYVCTFESGEPKPADIIDEVGWFALRNPPPLALPAV